MAHSTDYYQTGGGILYIAEWDGTTPPEEGDYVDAGNCVELSIQPEVEWLEHKSHRGGTAKTDKKVATESKLMINFKLDEIQEMNLKIFFMGDTSGTTIRPLNATSKEYAVKFVADPETGNAYDYELWRVQMSPAEALNIINMGEWATMGFSGEVLEDSTNNSSSPFGEVSLQATA